MKLILIYFGLFFSVAVSAQEKDTIKIENLKKQLLKSDFEKQLIIYDQLAHAYLYDNDSLALVYAQKMLDVAKLSNKELKQAVAFSLLGKSSQSSSKTEALDYFKQATAIFEKYDNIGLKDSYYNQSDIYTTFSDFPNALKFGLMSLEFNKKNNLEKNILRDLSSIGYIYDRMYEYKESIKWNRKALTLAHKLKDEIGEAKCLGRIGIAYDELAERDNFNIKLFDSALFYNKEAVKISEANGDLSFARITYSNIGNTYSKLKMYDEAEKYTLKSLKVPGFEDRKGVTLVNLGKIYLETGRYAEAKKVLDSAMQNTVDYGTRKYQFEAYYRLHELDVKTENYKSALQNYIEYKTIEDALLNETKTEQVAEMSERYKSAEKETQLAQTRATIAEQHLSIQQKNIQIYGLVISALILSLLGYLFYNQQKLKNRQLQKESELKNALVKIETHNRLQEQRLRISRDLHDNIGAQLTFIISSLDNLKYGFKLPKKLSSKLKMIGEFTSTTINDLRDTIWAMNKNEITFEDLEVRISNFIEKANLVANDTTFNFSCDEKLGKSKAFISVEGMNLYRIIQEGINNAIKYAQAKDISVHIKEKENNLEFIIQDNGIGFNINDIEFGNGIINMKKRAKEIQAQINIDSTPNKGTTITLSKPINK